MITISNLKKIYGETVAVDIDQLELHEGELVSLVGNNGAGKTTLMRLMLDLIRADEGQVAIDGQPVATSVGWKEFTGSFVDGRFLIDYLTPEEYFSFIADVYHLTPEELEERLEPYKSLMHDEILGQKKYLRDLSQGNRQKVGIIGAMMLRPRILILDEPFNYLDPSSQNHVARLIEQLCREQGTLVILSSHNLSFVGDISSRVILMEKGRVLRDFSPVDDAAKEEISRYFE